MARETCDIVDDAGGWTCRTCRAHWRTSVPPAVCADTRLPRDAAADRAAERVAAILVAAAVLCLVVAAVEGLAR